ncbi:MAG: protein kinase domain-containing protein, partial [Limisphaerales bacterium]
MTTDTHRNICPKCQSTIPADAPGNLCPRCVMATLGATTDQPRPGLGDVPSIEQLAAIFPQLEVIELIGRGGMGFVFKARQLHLDREVALKLLPEKLGTDPHFAERFTREARVLAKLNHPNIVMVHDFGFAGGFYYLTMEYVEGMNLRQAMRMGKFSPAEALAIVPKICDALQFAHEQGILHRDIKPENLLLDVRGRVKIADFGIAKLVGEENTSATLTGTGASLGTPHYMAPEQFENPGQVDHRADIYSLGVVFYEMLTGELPLGHFSAPSARADLDERIDAIVLRALARERDLRQKDARQLQTEVETVATTTPNGGARLSPTGRAPLRERFWPQRWKVAATVAGATFLLLAVAYWQSSRKWERAYWQAAAQSQGATPSLDTNPLSLSGSAIPPDLQEIPSAAPKTNSDPATLQRQEDAVASARGRYEAAQAMHSRGELSDRDLALANRDVVFAEARGDALAIAKAHYDFLEWEYHQVSNGPYPGLDAIYKLEQEMNKAHHAIERAKAGTNPVQKALADLKYAE